MSSDCQVFQVDRSAGTLRVQATGNIVASSVESQREFLLAALEKPEAKVVLNLEATEQIDSLGITLILGVFKSCQKQAIGFEVEGVSANIFRIFRLFSLTKLFPVRTR